MPRNVIYYDEWTSPAGHAMRLEMIPADATTSLSGSPTYVRFPRMSILSDALEQKSGYGDVPLGFREGDTLRILINVSALDADLREYINEPEGPEFDATDYDANPASHYAEPAFWYWGHYSSTKTLNLWILQSDLGTGGSLSTVFVGVQRATPVPKGRRAGGVITKEIELVDAYKAAIESIARVQHPKTTSETLGDYMTPGYAFPGFSGFGGDRATWPMTYTLAARAYATNFDTSFDSPLHCAAVDGRWSARRDSTIRANYVGVSWIWRSLANCVTAWLILHTRNSSSECEYNGLLPLVCYAQNWRPTLNSPANGWDRIGSALTTGSIHVAHSGENLDGWGQFARNAGKNAVNGCESVWNWHNETAESLFRKVSRKFYRIGTGSRVDLRLDDLKLYQSWGSHSSVLYDAPYGSELEWEEAAHSYRAANATLNARGTSDIVEFKEAEVGTYAEDELNLKFNLHTMPPIFDRTRPGATPFVPLLAYFLPDWCLVHATQIEEQDSTGAIYNAWCCVHPSVGIDLGGSVGVIDYNVTPPLVAWVDNRYRYDIGSTDPMGTERASFASVQRDASLPTYALRALLSQFRGRYQFKYELELPIDEHISPDHVGDVFRVARPDDTLYAMVSEDAFLLEATFDWISGKAKCTFVTL